MKLVKSGILAMASLVLASHTAAESAAIALVESSLEIDLAKIDLAEIKLDSKVAQAQTLKQGAEADRLFELGTTAIAQQAPEQAIEHLQSALEIYRQLNRQAKMSQSLFSMGEAYEALGELSRSLDYYQPAIAIQKATGDRTGVGETSYVVCRIEYMLSNFANALAACQQATVFLQDSEEVLTQLYILNLTGIIHIDLGQYDLAKDILSQALSLAAAVEEPASEGRILSDIGLTFQKQGNLQQAVSFYEQAIAIHKRLDDQIEMGRTLNKLGEGYRLLGDNEKSIETLQLALAIATQFQEELRYQGAILDSLGSAYQAQNNYSEALLAYRNALAIHRKVGSQGNESVTLKNIGDIFVKQEQEASAIVFYKTAVNVTEDIRDNLQSLSQDTQEAYVQTVADTYRQLANLLLQNNRLLEAQQVLELLKLEEIRAFTRATYTTTDGLQYDPVEQRVVDAHGSLIELGTQISLCKPDCDQSLYKQQASLKHQYDTAIQGLELAIRQNRAQDDVFYDPDGLASDASDIVNAQPGTVLIYPVVLEDSLWILWTATGGVVGRVEVEMNRTELNQTVFEFRELLQRRDATSLESLKQKGRLLYSWLIEPLQAELDRNNVQRLVFAQDRATRYLPMAALYDGEQFLIENYTVSTVLSAALTDTQDRLGKAETAPVLGLGLSRGIPGYPPLPNVAEELDALVKSNETDPLGLYPGHVFIDDEFTFDTISQHVQQHRILHIASHAEFVAEAKDASYILSGKGQPLTIADLGSIDLQFDNLHLVVLSACQTALGSTALDGTEIAGLSSYFLGKNKAEAVIASLWRVDDAGTSLLMQRFYQLLASGELNKAEALRAAQLSLLQDADSSQQAQLTRGLAVKAPESTPASLAHPYYWAPFVLIGNSL